MKCVSTYEFDRAEVTLCLCLYVCFVLRVLKSVPRLLMTEFDRAEVTLCDWQHVKVQLFTYVIMLSTVCSVVKKLYLFLCCPGFVVVSVYLHLGQRSSWTFLEQTDNNNNNQDYSDGIVKMLHGLTKHSGPDNLRPTG